MNEAGSNLGRDGSASFFQTLKLLLAGFGTLLHTRLELFVIELEEEREPALAAHGRFAPST